MVTNHEQRLKQCNLDCKVLKYYFWIELFLCHEWINNQCSGVMVGAITLQLIDLVSIPFDKPYQKALKNDFYSSCLVRNTKGMV